MNVPQPKTVNVRSDLSDLNPKFVDILKFDRTQCQFLVRVF
jgi:hypothetical protein